MYLVPLDIRHIRCLKARQRLCLRPISSRSSLDRRRHHSRLCSDRSRPWRVQSWQVVRWSNHHRTSHCRLIGRFRSIWNGNCRLLTKEYRKERKRWEIKTMIIINNNNNNVILLSLTRPLLYTKYFLYS